MTNTRIEVLGAKEAVRSLNKLEPGLRKQFVAEAQAIGEPAFEEARRRYANFNWGVSRLQNVAYKWNGPATGGRQLFPFKLDRAYKGLKIRVEGDRRKTAVIVLEQRDAATAVLESAGRTNKNPLGDNMGPLRPGHTRVLGPALFSKKEAVNRMFEKQILSVVKRVNEELR
jgi:hypothetical protein